MLLPWHSIAYGLRLCWGFQSQGAVEAVARTWERTKLARFSVHLRQQDILWDGGVRFSGVLHCWLGSGCTCVHFVHLAAVRDTWGARTRGCSYKETAWQVAGLGGSGCCRCGLLLSRLPKACLGGTGSRWLLAFGEQSLLAVWKNRHLWNFRVRDWSFWWSGSFCVPPLWTGQALWAFPEGTFWGQWCFWTFWWLVLGLVFFFGLVWVFLFLFQNTDETITFRNKKIWIVLWKRAELLMFTEKVEKTVKIFSINFSMFWIRFIDQIMAMDLE